MECQARAAAHDAFDRRQPINDFRGRILRLHGISASPVQPRPIKLAKRCVDEARLTLGVRDKLRITGNRLPGEYWRPPGPFRRRNFDRERPPGDGNAHKRLFPSPGAGIRLRRQVTPIRQVLRAGAGGTRPDRWYTKSGPWGAGSDQPPSLAFRVRRGPPSANQAADSQGVDAATMVTRATGTANFDARLLALPRNTLFDKPGRVGTTIIAVKHQIDTAGALSCIRRDVPGKWN